MWAGALLALVTAGAFMAQGGLALWAAGALLAWILAMRMPRPALLSWLVGVVFGLVLLGIRLAVKGPGGVPGAAALFAAGGLWPHQLLQTVPPPGAFPSAAPQLLPPGLGLVSLALAALVFIPSVPRGEQEGSRGELGPVGALAGVPVLLALAPVASLWGGLPGLARTVTFPYQLLLVGAPWLALLAGRGARALLDALPAGSEGERSHDVPLVAAILAVMILGSYGGLQARPAPGPAPERPVAIYGQDLLALTRADALVDGDASPVRLSVQWQALRPVSDDYTLFVHLVDGAGGLWGQQDAPLRTSLWQPGRARRRRIRDRYKAGWTAGSIVARVGRAVPLAVRAEAAGWG